MISVYNESRAAWGLEQVNDTVIRFTKTKEKRTDLGAVRKRCISIIAYTMLFKNLSKTKADLVDLRETKQPGVLNDAPTTIMFNNKEFKPFITDRESNRKNILLGTIFLGGKKIIDVKNDNSFLLEFFVIGAEFSFITSFNNPEATMRITLLDEKTKTIHTYIFSQDKATQAIVLDKQEHRPSVIHKKTHRIRIFRPSRPTKLILVHEKDREALRNTMDTTKHEVLSYNRIDDAITKLIDDNYKAVTLFTKAVYRKENAEERKRYGSAVNQLTRKFPTVYKLHLDKKVDKVKY